MMAEVISEANSVTVKELQPESREARGLLRAQGQCSKREKESSAL